MSDLVAVASDESELLAALAVLEPLLRDDALRADAASRLTPRVVEALTVAGLLRMRLPAVSGGRESSIATQMRLITAIAEIDPSTAWCTMVANNAVARIATTMPEQTLAQVFADGIPVCSVVATPAGIATPVEGGYRLTGTWRLATGIAHSEWVFARSFVEGDRSRILRFVVPAWQVRVVDSWSAVGLRATGSADFVLDDVLVPAALATEGPDRQMRGSRSYEIDGVPVVEAYEHLAFAIGVGRRALTELAASLTGDAVHRRTSDREVVHAELGRANLRLAAAESLGLGFARSADQAATGGPNRLAALGSAYPRALAVEATEVALDCVHLAFRRGASRSVYAPNVVERLLRDMATAGTHIVVDDTAFADYGAQLLTGTALIAGGAR